MKSYNYKGTFDAIRQISSKEGILALYKAYGATILSFGPFTGIHLAFYDKFKSKPIIIQILAHRVDILGLNNLERPITFFESFLLSSASGFIASIVTNPLDIVKTRMQVQRAELKTDSTLVNGRYGYRNIFHGLYLLCSQEGVVGCFRGAYARITYLSMQSILALTLLESVRNKIMKGLYSEAA